MPPIDIIGENHIPDAVRRSSERADEIARLAGVANVPDAETAPAGDAPPAGGTPPAYAETPPAAPPVEQPQQQPQPNEWEQKYRTLQGKYDAEVPGLRSQVNGLERVLATLETRTPQQPVQPDPVRATPTVVATTSEDIEAYGQDLIDAVRRWARAEVQPMIDAAVSKIDSLGSNFQKVEQSHQQTVVGNARNAVCIALDADPKLNVMVPGADGKNVPLWVKTNNDPGFIAWIKSPDPFSGQIRQPLLQGAFDAGQADRVKLFFNTYLSEHTATQVPAQDQPHTPQQPQADGRTGRPTLEDFAAPGRGGPATPPSSGATEKRNWTSKEIAAFYRDVNRGMYAERVADKQRIELDIFNAAAEGRIS